MPASVETISINNRRYLGNKFKLLSFIKEVVSNNCPEITSFADLFAGTGAVASGFSNEHSIITNDILYCNYICNFAWFSSIGFDQRKIQDFITTYNTLKITQPNYMSRNFADTYFSKTDCKKIGFIRDDIEQKFLSQEINERERAILIMSLIYGMDRIAKTCGHYDAYRKGVEFDEHLVLKLPLVPQNNNPQNICYNEDINILVKRIVADIVYLDPPYNSRQYCDAYHLLENVARWEKPKLTGVAKKMDRSKLKSAYCNKNAINAFEDLIENISAKYILLSYNNMSDKGNDRSNARMKDCDITKILEKKGNVKIFEQHYKAFSTGKSDIKDNKERLFLCICK